MRKVIGAALQVAGTTAAVWAIVILTDHVPGNELARAGVMGVLGIASLLVGQAVSSA